MLKQDLPPTASLVIGGAILWLVIGLGVGILSATRARSLFDRVSTVGVLVGLSMPVFVVGELLILLVFVPLNEHGFTWIQAGYAGLARARPVGGAHDAAVDHPRGRPGRRLHPADPRLSCSRRSARTTSGPPGPRACPSAG